MESTRNKAIGNQRPVDTDCIKYTLDEGNLPKQWYNIQTDLKTPAPPVMHPATGQPIGRQDLAPLCPMELIKQEVSREGWIDIADEVRNILRQNIGQADRLV